MTRARAREGGPRRLLRDPAGSRLTRRDLIRVSSLGLRSRRVRAALSALGIGIGIAAIVGVMGISQSSKTQLLSELGQLSNLLTVAPGSTLSGGQAELPATAEGMVSRIGPVTGVAELASLANISVYRTPFIPAINTNGISVTAADPRLPSVLHATMAHGVFLNAATARYPTVVLGAEAARLLGVRNLTQPAQVLIGGRWFTVVGILNPIPQQTPMDAMAFIGFPVAEQDFAFDGDPTELFVRTVNDPAEVSAVYKVLPATVNPANPAGVQPAEAASAIQAELLTAGAYNTLFVALGAVALLVGGVGIANVMVIAVLERRSEIGLRRALGAKRRHIAEQFLTEALLLSALGGMAGTLIGVAATAVYALSQHWHVMIPPLALYGGITAALAIGATAGLYPATRAARQSPADALRTA